MGSLKRSRAPKTGSEIRQGQIVDIALELVARHGVQGLTMGAIADGIGVVPSALYRHFSSKDGVLDALIDHLRGRLLGNVAAVCAATDDALERLRLLYLRHLEMIRSNRGLPRLLFSEGVVGGSAGRRARFYEALRAYLDGVAGIARDGQEQGTVRGGCPESIALLFLGLVQPAAILWHVSDGGFDLDATADSRWRLFAQAIGSEPSAERAGGPPAGTDSPGSHGGRPNNQTGDTSCA